MDVASMRGLRVSLRLSDQKPTEQPGPSRPERRRIEGWAADAGEMRA